MADEIRTPALHFISGANLPTGVTEAEQFLPSSAQQTAVAEALSRLDRDRARVLVSEVAGSGQTTVDLSTVTGWIEGASDLLEVDYPFTFGEQHTLDFASWDVLTHSVNGDTLCLFESQTIGAGESAQLKFSVPWTEATVPATLKYKVAKLAAANMARMIAARMAQSHESTIQVDTFGRNVAAGDWDRIAKALEKEYRESMGLDKDSPLKPAWGECQVIPPTGHGLSKMHDYPSTER
jgi:hypothetical protein